MINSSTLSNLKQTDMLENTIPASENLFPEQGNVDINLNDAKLKLQSCLQYIIDNNVKGKDNLLKVASQFKIGLSFSSLYNKVNAFKTSGAKSLVRKEKSDRGLVKSFSKDVLMKLQSVYCDKIRGGSAVRAYEDTHKYLRGISKEFIVPETGEAFVIFDGYICDATNNQILSYYTTKFVPGIYKLKPEFMKTGECELQIGSYASASRFLKHLKKHNADALFFHRFGIHDYRNKRQHAMKINYSDIEPNEEIVGDGKLLDILVISDDWRRVYRPYLMGWCDSATRRYCYAISHTENSDSIANSLSVAVNLWGIPKICKHDNGKSYLSGRFAQMKTALNIKTKLATVKLARAKMIESLHHTIDELLKTQIGYTGNKREEFPLDTRERLKLVAGHQRKIDRLEKQFKESDNEFFLTIADNSEAKLKSSKRRFMHISELEELLKVKFDEYHEKIHRGLQKDKLGKKVYDVNCAEPLINRYGEKLNTPDGRYAYKVECGFIPVKADPSVVSMYAMNLEIRTIQLKTGINLKNEQFYSEKLAKYAGEKVLIRYTHTTADTIYVFHSEQLQKIGGDKKLLSNEILQGLDFVCLAERQKLIDYNDADFRKELYLQRAEEKKLRETFSSVKSEESVANVLTLTGSESQSEQIAIAEEQYKINKLHKLNPVKKLKNYFDD